MIPVVSKKPGAANSGIASTDRVLRIYHDRSFGRNRFEIWRGRQFTGAPMSSSLEGARRIAADRYGS